MFLGDVVLLHKSGCVPVPRSHSLIPFPYSEKVITVLVYMLKFFRSLLLWFFVGLETYILL